MNGKMILDAMTDIDHEYILSAQKRLEYHSSTKPGIAVLPRRHGTLRRALALAAVMMLMLSVCLMTAMAASQEFREMVFEFLNIGEPEMVPTFTQPTEPEDASASGQFTEPEKTAPTEQATVPTESQMYVEPQKILIGGMIEGTYVHTPIDSLARNGVFLICTDEVMMNTGNHYDAYVEENGELLRLEEKSFCQDYTILGSELHIEFQWAEYHGECIFTYLDSDTPVSKQNLAGHVTATLMEFPCEFTDANGQIQNTKYPVLIDLETGDLTDVLAGTGAEQLPNIYKAAISKDLSKMLLVCWNRSEDNIYYVDLAAKKLYSLDELSGEVVDECCLNGDTLSCWNQDPDTGETRVWAFDLTTMERREVYTGFPVFIQGFDVTSHWGNMHLGVGFALEADAEDRIYAVDLKNGEKYLIEGLYNEGDHMRFIASPDGEKILVFPQRTEAYYASIGILDFTEKTYLQFSRENMNGVEEHLPYWFDNESVVVPADDGTWIKDYYIYRLIDEAA